MIISISSSLSDDTIVPQDSEKTSIRRDAANWTHDLQAASWASPLIADNKVYVTDEDGDALILELSLELNVLAEINMGSACYTTPIVANDTIFICIRDELFAFRL